TKNSCQYFFCECLCGHQKEVRATSILSRDSRGCKSCMCKQKTHGKSKTSEFGIWPGMKDRCCNKKNPNYFRYGGRAIGICASWINSFEKFIKDMGERPSRKHSIERIENDKGYCLSNCKWATQEEQCNNRSNNVKYKGESMKEASSRLGGSSSLVRNRLHKGWSMRDAFTRRSRYDKKKA
ncbi:hypothetical protein KA005_49215, partial [bacterium]|nr:hypothetical protein [bacterium]